MNFDFYIGFYSLILFLWIFEGFSCLPPSHSSVPKAVPSKKRISIPRPRNPSSLPRAIPQAQIIQKRILLPSRPKGKTPVRNPDGSLYGYHEESPAQRKIERPQQFFPLSVQIARERKLHSEEGSQVQTPHWMQNQRNAQIHSEARRLKATSNAKVKELEGEDVAIASSVKPTLLARAQAANLMDGFAQVNLKSKLENRADLLHAGESDLPHGLSPASIYSKDDRATLEPVAHTVKPANTESFQEEGQAPKSQFPYSLPISSHVTQEKLTPKALQSRPGRYGILRDPLNQRLHAGPQFKAEELMKGRVPSVSKAELAGVDDITKVGSLEQLDLKVKEGETEYAKRVGQEKAKNDEKNGKGKETPAVGLKADAVAAKEKQPIGLPPKTFPAPVGEIQRFPTDLVGGLNLPSNKGEKISENTFQKINKEIRENNGPNTPNTLKWATAKEEMKDNEKAQSQSSTKLSEKLPKIPYEILNHQKTGTPKKKPSEDEKATEKGGGDVTPAPAVSNGDDTKEGVGKVGLTSLSLNSKQAQDCDSSKGSNAKIPSSAAGCSSEASQEMLEPPMKRPSSGDQTSTIALPPQETAKDNDSEFNKMSKAVYEVLEEMAFEGGSHMVEIKSSGCDDPPANGNDCEHAVGSIKFDGEELSKGVVGFNLVVMSYPDLVVRNAASFKTGINAEESQRMAKFLMNLKGDNVIFLAAKGDGNSAAGQELYDALTLYGMRSPFMRLPRSSLAFVGCRGDCSGPWVQQVQRKPKEGPSVISLVIGPQDEFVSVGGGGNRMFELTKPKEKAAKDMNSGYNAGEKVEDQSGPPQDTEQQPKESGSEQLQPSQSPEQETKTPSEQQATPSEQGQSTQQQPAPDQQLQPPGENAPEQQETSQESNAVGPSDPKQAGKATTQEQQQQQPPSKSNEQGSALTQNEAASVTQGDTTSVQLAPGEKAPELSQAGILKPEEQNPTQGEQPATPHLQNGQTQAAATPDQVETQQQEQLNPQESKFTKCQDNNGDSGEPNGKGPCSVEGGDATQGAAEVTHTVSVQETTTPTSQKVKVDEMLKTKEKPVTTNSDASPGQIAAQHADNQGEGMQDGIISIPINPPVGIGEGSSIPDASFILHHSLNDESLAPTLDRNVGSPAHGAGLAHGFPPGVALHAGLKGIQSRGKTAGALFPSTAGKQEEMPGNEKEGSGINLESFSQKESYSSEHDHNRLHLLSKGMSLKSHSLLGNEQIAEMSKPGSADQELKKIIELKGKNSKQPSDIAKAEGPASIPSGKPVFLEPQVDDMGTEAEADNEPLADTIVNANLGSDLLDRAHPSNGGLATTEQRSQSITKTTSPSTQHLPQNPYYLQRASRKPDTERTQALLKFFRPDFSRNPIVVSHQDIEAAVREEDSFSDPPPGAPLPISNPKPESKLQLLQQNSEYQNYKGNPQFAGGQSNKPTPTEGKTKPKKQAPANSGPLFEIQKTMKPNQLWSKVKKPGASKDKDTASLLAAHSYKLPRPHQRPVLEAVSHSNESNTVKPASPVKDGSDEQEEGGTNPYNIVESKLLVADGEKSGSEKETEKEVDKTRGAMATQGPIPNQQAQLVDEKRPPGVEKEANENQAGGTQFDEHTLQDGSISSAAGTGNDNPKETATPDQNSVDQQNIQEAGEDESRKPTASTHAQKVEASPEGAKDQSSLSNGGPEAVSATTTKEQEKPDQGGEQEKSDQGDDKEKPKISVNIDDSNVTISTARQQEDDFRQDQTGSPQEEVAGDAVAGTLPTVLPVETDTSAEKEKVGNENANQMALSNNSNESSAQAADQMGSQSVAENFMEGSPQVNEANSAPGNPGAPVTHQESVVNSQDASHQVENVVSNMKDKETMSNSENVGKENSKEMALPEQGKGPVTNNGQEGPEPELVEQKTPGSDVHPQSSVEMSRASAVLGKEIKSHHLPKTFLKRQQANLDRLQKIMEGIEMLQKIEPVESIGQLKDNDMGASGKQYSKPRTKGQKGLISDGCPHGTIYKRNWMKGGKKGKLTPKRLTKKDCMPIPHVTRSHSGPTNFMYAQDAKESIASIKNRHDYQELAGEQAGGNPNDVAYYFSNNDRDKKEGDMLIKTKDNVFADTHSNIFDNGDYLRAAENMLRSDYQMAYSEAKAAFDKSTHEIQRRLGDTGRLPFRTDKRRLQTRNPGKKSPAEVNTDRYRRVMPMAKPTKAKKKP